MDPNGPWAGGDETHLVPLSGGNCLSILFLCKIGAGGAGRNYFVVIGAELLLGESSLLPDRPALAALL